MKKCLLGLAIAMVAGCAETGPSDPWRVVPTNLSPRLATLWSELSGRGQVFTETDWQAWLQAQGHLPMVDQDQILFLLRPDFEAQSVEIGASFLEEGTTLTLTRLGRSGVWGVVVGLSGQDFHYIFLVTSTEGHVTRLLDPANPERLGGKFLRSRFWVDPSQHGRLVWVEPNQVPTPEGMQPRGLFVWLPPDFDPSGATRYPVTYWADGQQLWDSPESHKGGWKVDTISDRLILAGQLPAMIHVGLPNSGDREDEYIGVGILNAADSQPDPQALALYQAHSAWIRTVVKPWIDAHFPTRPEPAQTAFVGSSFGGSLAITLGLGHPETLGRVAALSIAANFPPDGYWTDGKWKIGPIRTQMAALKAKPPVRIWVDAGSEEGDLVLGAQWTRGVLEGLGFRVGADLAFEITPGGYHTEADWSARLDRVLTWLWGSTGYKTL